MALLVHYDFLQLSCRSMYYVMWAFESCAIDCLGFSSVSLRITIHVRIYTSTWQCHYLVKGHEDDEKTRSYPVQISSCERFVSGTVIGRGKSNSSSVAFMLPNHSLYTNKSYSYYFVQHLSGIKIYFFKNWLF